MIIRKKPSLHADRVGSSVYWDPDLYEREQEMIFGKAWLFVGLEEMIPRPGDFVTNHMGEDPVIVCRDKNGGIAVLLNRCRHRGNKVCLFDRGNAKSFRCSYHGWTYATNGDLSAVPALDRYPADFRTDAGLVQPPKVATYRGLIFASWDVDAMPLDDYLGEDFRWYLDRFLLDDPDGLESLGCHRYMIPSNWKHLAENFGGDLYHFVHTHASVIALAKQGKSGGLVAGSPNAAPLLSVSCTDGGRHAPHGVLNVLVGSEMMDRDLQQAGLISPAAVQWVAERNRRRAASFTDTPVPASAFNNGNIFPNLSFNGISQALHGRSFMQWHPRGPELTEMRQWCFVEKSAPPEVKEYMATTLTVRQSATGLVTGDDIDNFQRMRDVLHTTHSKRIDFNYDLALGMDAESTVPGLPGHVYSGPAEGYHRAFYRYWQDQVRRGG
jgi:phenylpropionate dioxygenase-like ring-hydroxylating dioxygenase large terminal subunit